MLRTSAAYLAHHGITGQKHGVRNGPPYPLSRQQMSAGEVKQATKSELAKKEDSTNNSNGAEKAKTKSVPDKNSTPQKETYLNQTKKNDDGDTPVVRKLASPSDVYNNRTNLTDKQLRDYLDRVSLENRVAELAVKEYENNHKVKTFMKNTAKRIASDMGKKASEYAIKQIEEAMADAIGINPSKQNQNQNNQKQGKK